MAKGQKRPWLSGARFRDSALNIAPSHSMIYSSLSKPALVSVALLAACYDSCARRGTANSALNEPQISIETKYVSISLKVDAELRRFGELFDDCWAEGKAWFNKTNADAAAEWRDNRKAFRGLQW